MSLTMDLPPLKRRVRPAALSRAVANLLDNALSHGRPPLRLVLRAEGAEGFEIQVWDGGEGIAAEHWEQALRPFQRLDLARGGGRGHSGLGLAIADRVARDHGGELRRLENDPAGSQGDGGLGFGLALRGHSLPLGLIRRGAVGAGHIRSHLPACQLVPGQMCPTG